MFVIILLVSLIVIKKKRSETNVNGVHVQEGTQVEYEDPDSYRSPVRSEENNIGLDENVAYYGKATAEQPPFAMTQNVLYDKTS